MRRTERYTVPFPPAEPAPPELYHQRFREFPFWYRWYLRVVTVLTGSTVDRTVRAHELQELRRRLGAIAPGVVDPAVPALLPDFHRHLRLLVLHRDRLRIPLHEVTVNRRGPFLLHLLKELDPGTFRALEDAATLPEDLMDSTETTRALALETVRAQLLAQMASRQEGIRQRLEPRWTSLRALYLLARFDMTAVQPVNAQGLERIPLRVVRTPIQELSQLLALVQLQRDPAAMEIAWEFLRRVARMNPGPPGVIYHTVEEFLQGVPLEDLVRLAWDDPHLYIPTFSIRSEWWTPFQQAWLSLAADRTGADLFQRRITLVNELVQNVFLSPVEVDSRLPSELYPATVAQAIRLAGSELFQDTRRTVTQLVIDAVFHHLDTRNALHQAALQIDQSLERLTALLGDGKERRGTLGEEMHRIYTRAGNASFARRQLVGLYERHRLRIRTALEDLFEALISAGSLISRTVDGQEEAFEYRTLKLKTSESEIPPMELLEYVAQHWQPLGRRLRALYRMESET